MNMGTTTKANAILVSISKSVQITDINFTLEEVKAAIRAMKAPRNHTQQRLKEVGIFSVEKRRLAEVG